MLSFFIGDFYSNDGSFTSLAFNGKMASHKVSALTHTDDTKTIALLAIWVKTFTIVCNGKDYLTIISTQIYAR